MNMETNTIESDDDRPSLLVVDDDRTFCRMLKRAMERRGFEVTVAHSAEQGLWAAEDDPPEFALVDLNMPGGWGLGLIEKLKALDPATRIVVLTGYASVATAVEAIRLGAIHYLAKPAKPEEILEAFERDAGDPSVPVSEMPPSLDRFEWEHIQKVLVEAEGNISLAARQLGMHRRTLQRRLAKKPLPEQ